MSNKIDIKNYLSRTETMTKIQYMISKYGSMDLNLIPKFIDTVAISSKLSEASSLLYLVWAFTQIAELKFKDDNARKQWEEDTQHITEEDVEITFHSQPVESKKLSPEKLSLFGEILAQNTGYSKSTPDPSSGNPKSTGVQFGKSTSTPSFPMNLGQEVPKPSEQSLYPTLTGLLSQTVNFQGKVSGGKLLMSKIYPFDRNKGNLPAPLLALTNKDDNSYLAKLGNEDLGLVITSMITLEAQTIITSSQEGMEYILDRIKSMYRIRDLFQDSVECVNFLTYVNYLIGYLEGCKSGKSQISDPEDVKTLCLNVQNLITKVEKLVNFHTNASTKVSPDENQSMYSFFGTQLSTLHNTINKLPEQLKNTTPASPFAYPAQSLSGPPSGAPSTKGPSAGSSGVSHHLGVLPQPYPQLGQSTQPPIWGAGGPSSMGNYSQLFPQLQGGMPGVTTGWMPSTQITTQPGSVPTYETHSAI